MKYILYYDIIMTSISPKIFEDLWERIEKEQRNKRLISRLKNMVSARTFTILLGISALFGSLESCSVWAQQISQEIDGYEAGEVAHAQSIIQSSAFQQRMKPFLDELWENGTLVPDELYIILSDLYIAQRDWDEATLEYIWDELQELWISEMMLIKYGFQSI